VSNNFNFANVSPGKYRHVTASHTIFASPGKF